ncbi:MAG: hypothetical protein EAS52_18555 [Parapedobacter sp.]|nr:MAG: hypothetical protein EAS52_18555 [Parapedobacter sp.]
MKLDDADLKFLRSIKTGQLITRQYDKKDDPDTDLQPYRLKPDDVKMFYPKGDGTARLRRLEDAGILRIGTVQTYRDGTVYFPAEVLAPEILPHVKYFKRKPLPSGKEVPHMIKSLLMAELPPHVESTAFWDFFMSMRNAGRMDLFFSRDKFGYRIHTPVCSLKSTSRRELLLAGEPTAELDIAQSQPLIFSAILLKEVGDNPFSRIISDGGDIYTHLAERYALGSRELAKAAFFKLLFGSDDDTIKTLFGDEPFVRWIRALKSRPLPLARRNRPEPKILWDGTRSYHPNLAALLQRMESGLMRRYVWQPLAEKGIPFVSIHDSIIVRGCDLDTAMTQMQSLPLDGLRITVKGHG